MVDLSKIFEFFAVSDLLFRLGSADDKGNARQLFIEIDRKALFVLGMMQNSVNIAENIQLVQPRFCFWLFEHKPSDRRRQRSAGQESEFFIDPSPEAQDDK